MKWGGLMREQENSGNSTKYLIHAINRRMWYVENHLIPDMVENGIDKSSIIVYNDDKELGNLGAFLDSVKNVDCDLWHLQDDVIICRNFKELTEKHNAGVVCGFCSRYSEDKKPGYVFADDMWYSFPCIRIPASIMKEFKSWIKTQLEENTIHTNWIKANKYDDSLFMEFMKERYPLMAILNLKPNLVNHIDYLIGGSIVNPKRAKDAGSIYWDDVQLLEEWKERLKNGQSGS